ncbi:GTP-binding protein 1, partial [Pseudohyphozyma bogoriensis]
FLRSTMPNGSKTDVLLANKDDTNRSILAVLFSTFPCYLLLQQKAKLGLDTLHLGLIQVVVILILQWALSWDPRSAWQKKATKKVTIAEPLSADEDVATEEKPQTITKEKRRRKRAKAAPPSPSSSSPYPPELLDATLRDFIQITEPTYLPLLSTSSTAPSTKAPTKAALSEWTTLFSEEHIKVLQHPDKKAMLYAIVAEYPELPLRNLYETLLNVEKRRTWDGMCQGTEAIEDLEVGGRRGSVSWIGMKGMPMIKPKDMCLLSVVARLPPTEGSTACRLVCASSSTDHPLKSDYNRMELGVSGFMAESTEAGGSKVTQITDLSSLGYWIPGAVIRTVTQKMIPKSLSKLGRAAAEFDVAQSRYSAEGDEWLPAVLGEFDDAPTTAAGSGGDELVDLEEEEDELDGKDSDEMSPSSSRELHELVGQLRSLTSRLTRLEEGAAGEAKKDGHWYDVMVGQPPSSKVGVLIGAFQSFRADIEGRQRLKGGTAAATPAPAIDLVADKVDNLTLEEDGRVLEDRLRNLDDHAAIASLLTRSLELSHGELTLQLGRHNLKHKALVGLLEGPAADAPPDEVVSNDPVLPLALRTDIINTLKTIASDIGAELFVCDDPYDDDGRLRTSRGPPGTETASSANSDVVAARWSGKALRLMVRRVPDGASELSEVRVAVVGNVDAGKSSLLGVLTKHLLDDGRGRARVSLFRHKHEIESGRTSSVGMELLGFAPNGQEIQPEGSGALSDKGNVLAGSDAASQGSFTRKQQLSWEDIAAKASKIISFADLAGHERYLKTTLFGLTATEPGFVLLIVGANAGLIGLAKEHLSVSLALSLPLVVVVTKVDMCPPHILEQTVKQLVKVLKSPGCRKQPVFVKDTGMACELASSFVSAKAAPIFMVSNVTGEGLPNLKMFLNTVPVAIEGKYPVDAPFEFSISDVFSVPFVGAVVSGVILAGKVAVGDTVVLGPDSLGGWMTTTVKSIQRKRVNVESAEAGQSVSFALKRVKRTSIRKGQVLLAKTDTMPTAVRRFEGSAMLHSGSIRQTVQIEAILDRAAIRTGDKATVRFSFLARPEYIQVGDRFLFREGQETRLVLLSPLLLDAGVFEEFSDHRMVSKWRFGERRAPPRVKEADLKAVNALVREIREGDLSISDACQRFGGLSCVKAFSSTYLKEDSQKFAFASQARRYIAALRPDSGIAFHALPAYSRPAKSAASRQTPSPTPPPGATGPKRIEVGVFATRAFKKGEEIPLKGMVASLTDEEDDTLREGAGRDFSVLWSDRRQAFQLLMGPARFVNHDCFSNVVFKSSGTSMSFQVVEDIKADEQIFTHYGDHYFEENNATCLCQTCQLFKRGGFTPVLKKGLVLREQPRRASHSGSGHELTAQRSVSRPTRSSSISSLSSLSSLSSSRSNSPADNAGKEKRRSERTVVVVDPIRTGKRLVQAKLKPPPGYLHQYRWDERKKICKYIGPTSCDRPAKGKENTHTPATSPAKPSKVALGKRKRAADSSPPPSSRRTSAAKPAARRRVSAPLPPARLGTRTSARSRTAAFDRLNKKTGVIDDAELTDLSSDPPSDSSLSDEESSSESEESEEDSELSEEESDEGLTVAINQVIAEEDTTSPELSATSASTSKSAPPLDYVEVKEEEQEEDVKKMVQQMKEGERQEEMPAEGEDVNEAIEEPSPNQPPSTGAPLDDPPPLDDEAAPVDNVAAPADNHDDNERELALLLMTLSSAPPVVPAASTSATLGTGSSLPQAGSSTAVANASTSNAAEGAHKKPRKRPRPSDTESGGEGSNAAASGRNTRRNSRLLRSPSPVLAAPVERQPRASTSKEVIKATASKRSNSPATSLDPEVKRGRRLTVSRESSGTAGASPRESSREDSREGRSTRLSQPISVDLRTLMASSQVTQVSGGFDPSSGRYFSTKQAVKLGDVEPERVRSESPASVEAPKARPKSRQSSFGTLATKPRVPSPLSPKAASATLPASRSSAIASTSSAVASGSSPKPVFPTGTERTTRRSNPIAGDISALVASPEVAAIAGGYDYKTGKYLSSKRAIALLNEVGTSGTSGTSDSSRSESPELVEGASVTRKKRNGNGDASAMSATVGGFDPTTGKYTSRLKALKAAREMESA